MGLLGGLLGLFLLLLHLLAETVSAMSVLHPAGVTTSQPAWVERATRGETADESGGLEARDGGLYEGSAHLVYSQTADQSACRSREGGEEERTWCSSGGVSDDQLAQSERSG